jgi:hypothetical protein
VRVQGVGELRNPVVAEAADEAAADNQ